MNTTSLDLSPQDLIHLSRRLHDYDGELRTSIIRRVGGERPPIIRVRFTNLFPNRLWVYQLQGRVYPIQGAPWCVRCGGLDQLSGALFFVASDELERRIAIDWLHAEDRRIWRIDLGFIGINPFRRFELLSLN